MALPRWQATIVDDAGDILPSAEVTVIVESTGLAASLFSDRAGSTAKGASGVFSADTNGFAFFYADPAAYRITAEASGGGTSVTWNYVSLFDFDANVGTAAGEVPLNSTLVPKAGGTFTGDIEAPKITASTGVLFGTDTASANTLDDYETGTWTATVSDQSNMSGASIDVEEYTKIGNMVFAQIKGTFSVTSGAGVRTLFSFTLPFLQDGVFAGGGGVRSPSNLQLNPSIDDPFGGSAVAARLSFISYESGTHNFNIGIHYRGA